MDQYDSRAEDSGNGESLGFALRLGCPIGAKWGVELEFVRPVRLRVIRSPDSPLFLSSRPSRAFRGSQPWKLRPSDFPADLYEFRSTSALDAVHLAVGAAGDLLGDLDGVSRRQLGLGRTSNEVEITYTFGRSTILPTILPLSAHPATINDSISYDVQPMWALKGGFAWLEGGFVPGLRLHGAQGGWLIRPAVGLSWNF